MALVPVRGGEVATIVTSLEMRSRPSPRPLPVSPLVLVPWKAPSPNAYRALFRRVGEPWLWFSRLAIDDAALTRIIHAPDLAIYAAADRNGVEVGMLELDFAEPASCKIAYFGLVPELTGKGHGRWLMAHALMLGWRPGVERLWVHTCTLDHPKALNFYRAQGFVPFARTIETFDDPRVAGVLAPDAAPHIPLLASSRR